MEVREVIERELAMRQTQLDPRVGLYACQFTQPVDAAPLGTGAFHGYLRRIATAAAQSVEVTSWIAEKVSSHAERTVL